MILHEKTSIRVRELLGIDVWLRQDGAQEQADAVPSLYATTTITEEEVLTTEKLLETIQRVTKDCGRPLTPIVLDPHVRTIDGKLQIMYEVRPETKVLVRGK